jgi:hypothetical protein
MITLRRSAARRWAALVAAPFALAGMLTAAAPAVASAAGCIPVTGLPMPADPQGLDQVLNGAAVLGACDGWAVGATGGINTANQTLTEHYDGSGWTIVPSPSPGQGASSNVLTAVAAVSASNVWAVGSISSGQTLIEHWNGTNWTVEQTGIPGGGATSLSAVTATSATDIWAVGRIGGADGRPLIEHYDGHGWTVSPDVSIPAGNIDGVLSGVTATSATDAWAVGTTMTGNFAKQTLVERWNGTGWTVVPSANPGTHNQLAGVVALTPSNVWAVGSVTGTASQALIEHWNGRAWTQATIPAIGTSSRLNGVGASSDRNIWAAGFYGDASGSHTLAEQFDGNNWNVVPSPDGGQVSELFAAGTSSATSTWLVGAADGKTLTLNCC